MQSGGKMWHRWSDHPSPIEKKISCSCTLCPFHDMLVINAFVEFEDLMYSVGRIEDGIRRGKIVDTKASTMKKKKNYF